MVAFHTRNFHRGPGAGGVGLLNNYWHTNYKADQQGRLHFRFVLRPHGVEPPLAVMDLSRDLEQPLVVLSEER